MIEILIEYDLALQKVVKVGPLAKTGEKCSLQMAIAILHEALEGAKFDLNMMRTNEIQRAAMQQAQDAALAEVVRCNGRAIT